MTGTTNDIQPTSPTNAEVPKEELKVEKTVAETGVSESSTHAVENNAKEIESKPADAEVEAVAKEDKTPSSGEKREASSDDVSDEPEAKKQKEEDEENVEVNRASEADENKENEEAKAESEEKTEGNAVVKTVEEADVTATETEVVNVTAQ